MRIETLDGKVFKNALKGAAKFLENNKEEVNSLNVFPVPDGDTGTNMSLTVNSAVKQSMTIEENNISRIASAASHGSLMGARGNSGVILSQLFRGFANGLDNKDVADTKLLANALKQAADTAYKAVMKPTEGTILTVARECGDHALIVAKKEKDILRFLEEVIIHGNKVLDKTPDMLAVLKQAGVVDAGGKGLIYILTGAYNTLANKEIILSDEEEIPLKPEAKEKSKLVKSEDIEFGYCTEFIINGSLEDLEGFRQGLSARGDSLLVVGGEEIIKVHIHTNNPGAVLEEALAIGELSDIKIDNMRYQHEEVLLKKELMDLEEKKLDKEYSFVAVSIGKGIDDVFKDLNVDSLVAGGQTMNPSTEDILQAIEKTTGKNVFILPNNGNIILAAEQAKELSDRNVMIIPSKTIPQGISALLAFEESSSVEENYSNLKGAIASVKTGEVTYAVRDTEYNDKKISKDDIIGIFESQIVANGRDINQVSTNLLEEMIDEDSSLITILYGSDTEEDTVRGLEASLSEDYPDLDIEIIYGGQPLYYYIFSVE